MFRDAYNSAVAWINGSHADLRPWLVRYREHCCRVALNLQIASDPTSMLLTPEAAVQAACVVHWMLAQLLESQCTLPEVLGRFGRLSSKCTISPAGSDFRISGFPAALDPWRLQRGFSCPPLASRSHELLCEVSEPAERCRRL